VIPLILAAATLLTGYIAVSYGRAVAQGRGREWRRHFRDAWENQ
jgi:hypothetical protein